MYVGLWMRAEGKGQRTGQRRGTTVYRYGWCVGMPVRRYGGAAVRRCGGAAVTAGGKLARKDPGMSGSHFHDEV